MSGFLLTRSSFFPSLPALASRWLDTLTVTELSSIHLCFGHRMTGCAVPVRDTPSLRARSRESGYLTKEGTS